ncbi:MAG: beta-ketoacyl synthase chain length factor [Kiritimatiellae bacterium]|nr:beta-ketoacyl synthase chain length factor [Kiritimatiellia bacterium]
MNALFRTEWRATEESPRPDVSFVPPMERRRLTMVEKAAIAVAHRTLEQYAESRGLPSGPVGMPVVFASRWGEIGTTLKLMRQMHDEGEMSPAGFSNSVHNAAPGHLSLLLGDKAPYTAVAAGPDSYEMGLLEASMQPGPVLFVYAEEETPEMYRPSFPDPQPARAVAMIVDGGAQTGRTC